MRLQTNFNHTLS